MWFICLDVSFFACDLNVIYMSRCLHVYVVDMSFRVYAYFSLQVFDKMFEWVFHWLFNFLWCRFETMTYLFNVSIGFRGGNHQMFKVRYINVTLKGLKDQLDEINQGLNLGDTRKVEYIWYEHPTLDDGRITFNRLELKNDDDVKSIFSIFWQHNMFPWMDMFVTLLRSPEDILNNLIPLEDCD